MRSSTFNNQSALSRAIGLLLMIFILYGTTIEAAHRHGRSLPSTSNAAAIAQPETHQGTYGSKTDCNDCLICQLQLDFSTSSVAFRQADPPAQVRQSLVLSLQTTTLSQAVSPSAGRAPPFIS